MLDRILIPLDGSPEAEAILPWVRAFLAHQKANGTLLQAHEPAGSAYPGVDYAAVARSERAQMESYLGHLAATHQGEGLALRTRVVDGFAASAILKAAQDERSSMIAMTTHGRRGVRRWVLGSVAEKVLRGSDVPVLLLRSPAGEPAVQAGKIRRILLPIDGSRLAAEVVEPVIGLARSFGAEVQAIHVESPPGLPVGFAPAPPAPPAAEGETIGPVMHALETAKVKVAGRMLKGDPAEVLLQASDGVDLIAMTTHGRSGVSRLAFGSVTEKVLRESRVPMLVVRSKKAAAGTAAA